MTRRVMFAFAVILVVGACACDWPMDRFNAARTGFNGSEQTISPGNVGGLVETWRTSEAFGEPVVADGFLYQKNRDGDLAAFDANGNTNCTGTPRMCMPVWMGFVGSDFRSPAVGEKVVYIGGAGELFAFDATGASDCGVGQPGFCAPLWTADVVGKNVDSPLV